MMQKTHNVVGKALAYVLMSLSMLFSLLLSTFVVGSDGLLKARGPKPDDSCAQWIGRACSYNYVCLDYYGQDTGCPCDANNICSS